MNLSLFGDDEQPAEQAKLDPKAVAALERRSRTAEQFIDFLFRHLGSATYRFNEFFENSLPAFTNAFNVAVNDKEEALLKAAAAKKSKKKQKSKPVEFRVSSFRQINDLAVMLSTLGKTEEANELFAFLNHFGKMRGLMAIASNFIKFLKKAYEEEVEQLTNIEYYYTYWNAFTLRNYDYEELKYPKNLLPPNLSQETIGCIKWPLAIRTSLYCGVQFLKTSADMTEVQLLNNNWKAVQEVTIPEEFMCMYNIDESFYKRSARRQSFAQKAFIYKSMGMPASNALTVLPQPIGSLPKVDPQLLMYAVPIVFDTILLKFPSTPPVETKPEKKNKKKK